MNVYLTMEGARMRDRHAGIDPERVARLLDRLSPLERRRATEAFSRLAEAADAERTG